MLLKRIVLLSLPAGILGGLYVAGFFDLLAEPERVRAALDELGVWAPILYVSAFAILEPFFVPGLAFMLPGALYFSFAELFWLSWLGSLGAGIVGFSFARFLGRDYAERHMPERLRRYDEGLARHGLRTVILIRLTLFLAPPAHWLLGLSQVRFGAFVLGTAIGFLPGIALITFLIVYLGESFAQGLGKWPPWLFAGVAVAILLALRVRRQRADPRAEADQA